MAKIYELKVERKVYSVSDITRDIRFTLEGRFSDVWIEGEICNFKLHSSGHMYFSLKDESSQIQCVMFRRENGRLGFEPGEGMKVLVRARVSVYAARGQYQLYIESIEPKGVGALQLRFQQLVEKLRAEGLFEETRKRTIPYLPRTIGLVTSIDGAALRDILNILERRYSGAHLLIYPVAVQGVGAAESIAAAIDDFNTWKNADVLIVGRGGGSLEDLWAFNEEIVARAIFRSEVPVISEVGHEVDYTVADFVADLRAPTPSAAAELVMPLKDELIERIEELKLRNLQAMNGILKDLRQQLKALEENRSLRDPLAIFEIQFQKLDELKKTLSVLFQNALLMKKEKMLALIGKLEALGPLAILKRGFSVTLAMPGEKVVVSAGAVKVGDEIKTRLADGFFTSRVTGTAPAK